MIKKYIKYGMLIVIILIIIVKYRNEQTGLTNRDIKIYASFTSIPSRLNDTEKVIKSLLNQTYPIEKIIFNIPIGTFKRTGEEYFVPKYLEKYKDKVEVVRCKEYGPGTKLLGGLDRIPYDSFIYVIDDDLTIPKNHLERLVSHLDDDTDVVSNTLCYDNLIVNSGVCGFSGFIVNRNILDNIYDFFDKLPKSCYSVDDKWISVYLQKNNTNFKFGYLIDSVEPTIKCRLKDLIAGDPTALSNTTNNVGYFTHKNTICNKDLKTLFNSINKPPSILL